ncbi:phage tail protein [Enterobacter oligotrophicus]|uniref:phage tail protein n=2 Tax=Enterobacter oligotrophicus TaxID=2478464 RepID=UPI003570D7CA
MVGVALPFAMNIASTGWLICNGQEVSRAAYARLFSRIGTLYGSGDGSTTFEFQICVVNLSEGLILREV